MSLQAYIDEFTTALTAKGLSTRTIEKRQADLRCFQRYASTHNLSRIQDVTTDTIEDYSRTLQERNLTPNTVDSYLRSLRMFFNYLVEQLAVFENPTHTIQTRKPPKRVPKTISEVEVQRLIQGVNTCSLLGLRDVAILELAYGSALRRQELIDVRFPDLDLANAQLRVHGKGAKGRMVPLTSSCVEVINRYLQHARPALVGHKEDCDYLWLTYHGQPFGYEGVAHMLAAVSERAGLERVCSHTLRRSCATHMVVNGAPPVIVAQFLGHESVSTLANYLNLTVADLKAMHAESVVAK